MTVRSSLVPTNPQTQCCHFGLFKTNPGLFCKRVFFCDLVYSFFLVYTFFFRLISSFLLSFTPGRLSTVFPAMIYQLVHQDFH